ncbi:hypothetical protein HYW53_02165 [Candidatus Giovannonibacteria bacterium]|nr:hypothetical protein [Candidatus Giovannonibacteria bacterium]
MDNQKGFTNIVLIAVIVILVGTVGYFALTNKQGPATQQTITTPPAGIPTPTPQASTPTPADETANWKTHRNEEFGFEFHYPKEFPFGAGQKVPDTQGAYNYIFNISGPRGVGESIADFNVTPQEKLYPFGFSFKGEQPIRSLSQLKINIQRYVEAKNSVEQVRESVQITDFTTRENLSGLKAVYYGNSPQQPSAVTYYFYKDPYIYWFRSFGLEADGNVSKIASTFKFIK